MSVSHALHLQDGAPPAPTGVRLRRWRSMLLSVAVTFVALALPLLRIHTLVDPYDEGIILHGGERVAQGATPYRNFSTVYAPGQFYAVAAAYRVGGYTVSAERAVDVLFRCGLVLSILYVLVKLTSGRRALLPYLLATLAVAYTANFGYPIFPALVFALLSAICLFRFAQRRRCRDLVIAGLATAAAELFRQDVGIYVLLTDGLVIAAFSLDTSRYGRGQAAPALCAILRNGAWYAAGCATVIVPAGLFLVREAGASTVFDAVYRFPLTTLHGLYAKPIPRLIALPASLPTLQDHINWLLCYLPPAIFALAAGDLVRRRRTRIVAPTYWLELTLLLYGVLLFNQTISRFDRAHALPADLCALILLCGLLHRHFAAARRRGLSRPIFYGTAWAALMFALIPFLSLVGTFATASPFQCASSLPRAGCAALDGDQERTARYLQETTPVHAAIFVGNFRHDVALANDVALYFLADRPSAVRYSQFEPGQLTLPAVQAEMVAGLARQHVAVIVRTYPRVDDDTPAPDPNGSHLLDSYLQDRFHEVARNGTYEVDAQR